MYHLTVFKKQQVIRVSYQADTMWIIEFDLNKQCLQQTGHHASFKSTYFLKIMYLVGLDRNTVFIFYFLNLYLLIFRETEEGEGRENLFVVPLIDAFIDCFLCVPWPEMEPAAMVYQDSALTNWATQPGWERNLVFKEINNTSHTCLHSNKRFMTHFGFFRISEPDNFLRGT